MEIRRSGSRYDVELNDNEFVNIHRLSEDAHFSSVVKYTGESAIGVGIARIRVAEAAGLLKYDTIFH